MIDRPSSLPNPLTVPNFDPARAIQLAQTTFAIEAAAVLALGSRVSAVNSVDGAEGAFVRAVRLVLALQGRVVVMGMGKSGHVGRKIAATLASTGTPALFVHPAEASHGDLGMVTASDAVLAISNSGEVAELATILPVIRRLGVPLIALTGAAQSTLAQHADVVLDSSVAQEACPLNLAPTASTTAQLAFGDALAVALLDARGFKPEDFARSHPGGALGRKLLTHVRDVMRSGDAVPRVGPQATFSVLMRAMSDKRLGLAVVVDTHDHVMGVFTDGDLRRLVESGADLRDRCAQDVLHSTPRSIRPDALAVDAAELMEQHSITCVLVVAEGVLQGIVHIGDLMRAKVI